MRKVFIIGTHHVYQYGGGAVFDGVTCTPEQETKFRQLLTEACRSYRVIAIGEELSDVYEKKPVHLNGFNLKDVVPPPHGGSVAETLRALFATRIH